MIPKQVREVNEKYLEFIRQQCCCVCGLSGENLIAPHHVKSRGARGGDTKNTIPLCLNCHNLAHSGHIPKEWQREQAERYYKLYKLGREK